MTTSTQNKEGKWVPAIPEPYYGFKKKCTHFGNVDSLDWCDEKFWTYEGYRGHYALKHILNL